MSLPTITPTVAGITTAQSTPTDAEAANTLGQYVVQVKTFLASFLGGVFADSGSQPVLQAAALNAATLSGLVTGSTDNSAGTAGSISLGTVSTPDLRDGAVTGGTGAGAKIASATITTENIAAATILGSNIAAATVAGSNIVTGGVGAAQLAATAVSGTGTGSLTPNIVAASVGTPELAAQAVTTAKIADLNVTLAKLVASSTAGNILVASNATPPVFTDVPMTGDVSIDYTGKTTIASRGVIEFVEQAAANTAAGTSAGAAWNPRGVQAGYVKTLDTLGTSFATNTSGSASIVIATSGTFLITVSAPCYAGDAHQVRLVRYNPGGSVPSGMQQVAWGSSEKSTAAALVQTRSVATGLMTIAVGGFFQVEHFITTGLATTGLGVPVNATAESGETIYETYTRVRIQQVA